MKITAVSMVKDEADVLRYTVENLFRQGVDEMIVMNNMSTDETNDILSDLSNTYNLFWEIDHEVGYYQSEKMTLLANKAFVRGANWVIPVDADEYWTGVNKSLRESIACSKGQILKVNLYNYFNTDENAVAESPFERINHHDVLSAPLPKVIVSNVRNLKIHQGNHGADGIGNVRWLRDACIGHFPWRSYEQFERKISNGAKAYNASTLPKAMGSHWRAYGQLLEDYGSEGLKSHYDQWFANPSEVELVKDPIVSKYV